MRLWQHRTELSAGSEPFTSSASSNTLNIGVLYCTTAYCQLARRSAYAV